MCRHHAYLGAPRTLESLVIDRPHSLFEQSWAPRRQRHGTVNVDGFGVGWYADRSAPVRYRRAQAIWSDSSFASLAPTISTTSALAAVRSATVGMAMDESAAAPFTHDRWLFSHNGRLHDWTAARTALAARAADVPDTRVGVDSALLFGLALTGWRSGAGLADGLAHAARRVLEHGGGRLTMLAGDGTSIAGVVIGEPLHLCRTPHGTLLAAEPDDDEAWRELDDGAIVQVDGDGELTETCL